MNIRHKVALILALAVATTMTAASGVFVALQRRTLRAAEEEKVRLLLDDVRTMGRESQLANDPLMLLDYLSFLGRERPEILRARARFDGAWAGPAPSPLPGEESLRSESVLIPADGGAEILVELVLSRRVLDARLEAAQSAMSRDLLRAAALVFLSGLVLCYPLSRSLTARLVEIEGAMRKIGAGALDSAVAEDGADEVARLARGLNTMSARLREVDEMKRTFVASVTHELRSPLFAIESYVKELLRESKSLTGEDRRRLERIQANAARLAHFVTSLLDMARIERGQLDYRPRATDVAPLVEDVVEFLRSRAQEGGLELSFDADAGLPLLRADPDLLTQAVTNLVSNALKFTRRGGRVEVTVRRGGGGVECAVSDTGVGMPPETVARLFRPFERGADPLRAGGTGLGLSIARAIVERHGGALTVESAPGKGSRFRFSLPAADNKSLTQKTPS
jgi:signal transduction histidine kinase